MSTQFEYDEFFPFSSIRDEQRRAIQFALNAFLNEKKRFVILELGTGCGKSAIGITIARYLAAHGGKTTRIDADGVEVETTGAYILTTQKILQSQYMDDFGPSSGKNLIRSLKSAANYRCQFHTDMRCSDSKRVLNQLGRQLDGTEFQKCCRGKCPYTLDKEEFLSFPIGLTNFSYFLAETMYAKQLVPRGTLIVDEAHNLESELSKFVEVSFSEKFAKQFGIKSPKNETAEAILTWIKGPYKKGILKVIDDLEKKLSSSYENGGAATPETTELSKRYELLDKHICKVNRFINEYNPDNWVMNVTQSGPDEGNKKSKVTRKFEFKPVDVSSYGHEYFFRFGNRTVIMSATIVDKDTFCKSVGIDPADCAFLHIASPFPVKNRPIHYLGVGSMSMNNIGATLPKMIGVIRELLQLHGKEKGIIHCVNYKIAQLLVDTLKDPRLLLHGSTNREETIQYHMDCTDPTVLISPSMTEGVDLRDDASRFQILCKVPFPYLGDKVVQLRKQRDPSWYACQTTRTIIQAFGRSIRNENDHATSYILDTDWERFFRNNRPMFPEEFVEALI